VERLLTGYEDEARRFMIVVGGLLVLRFLLEYVGMWPWG
jgi:hypothetical protein